MRKYRFLTLIVAVTSSLLIQAQPNKRTSAWSALNTYKESKDASYLEKARVNIDAASEHPDTKDETKTWLFKGNVYLAIFQHEFNQNVMAIKDVTDAGKKQNMALLTTPLTNLLIASDAYIKGNTLDVKKVYTDDLTKGLGDCNALLQNAGIANYQQKKFIEASPLFEKAYEISLSVSKLDTNSLSNAAISAYSGGAYDKSIVLYRKLADVKYNKGNSWLMLGKSYLGIKDSAGYKKAIEDGLQAWPQDADLLTESVNIKMAAGQSVQAIEQLNTLVKQRPNDATLEFVVGNVYDRMANPTDAKGVMSTKPTNYEELLDQAVIHYKKAIEIDPKYGDALYNLGVLYYNQSVEYYNRSTSTLTDAAKYNTMWEKPLPEAVKYLEMARAINPTDVTTLSALKTCYGQMGNNEKYNELKAEIQKLKQQ